jgi:hypothetical protein
MGVTGADCMLVDAAAEPVIGAWRTKFSTYPSTGGVAKKGYLNLVLNFLVGPLDF